jgi:hypothetical protein
MMMSTDPVPAKKKKAPPKVKPSGRPARVKAVRVLRIPVNEDISQRFEAARLLCEKDNPAIDANDAVLGRILILKGIELLERERLARQGQPSSESATTNS